jgi:hypothetical protein
VRRALRNDLPVIQNQNALAQSKHFFAVVRDVENRDPVRLVPLA